MVVRRPGHARMLRATGNACEDAAFDDLSDGSGLPHEPEVRLLIDPAGVHADKISDFTAEYGRPATNVGDRTTRVVVEHRRTGFAGLVRLSISSTGRPSKSMGLFGSQRGETVARRSQLGLPA